MHILTARLDSIAELELKPKGGEGSDIRLSLFRVAKSYASLLYPPEL